MADLLLASDIGATNTRLRLVEACELALPLDEYTYGKGVPVEEAIGEYVKRIGARARELRAACFGVAGRVIDGDVRMTNRPGEKITDERLSGFLGLSRERVVVVNDMVAHLSGVEQSERVTLRAGSPSGTVEGIVMPGTGLGIGYAVRDSTGRRVAMPSEGGHLDFARNGWGGARTSWEWWVSGPGLARIYACLATDTKDRREFPKHMTPEDVTAAAFGQQGPLDIPTARRATQSLLELTGARAGNLCLDVLATRGVFLGGNLLNLLYEEDSEHFVSTVVSEFDACGPDVLGEMMRSVPLHLIRSADSGLRGAAVLAAQLISTARG